MVTRSIRTALLGVALATGTAGIASAETTAARVNYGDLNLQSAEGQRTLSHRVSAAADKVCDTQLTGTRITDSDRCRADVRAQVRADLDRAGVPTL